jgi:dynactin-5
MSRRPPRGEYIETDTGNKVARKATLVGTQNIMLGGKTVIMPDVMIRGDLIRTIQPSSQSAAGAPHNTTAVSIGRYCFLSRGCCLRPPGRLYKGYGSDFASPTERTGRLFANGRIIAESTPT